jgi:hypothetical protein
MAEETPPIKNLDDEKKKEQEQEENKAKAIRKSSFANVPLWGKILGVVFLFLKYNDISRRNGNLSEMWVYVIIVGIAWYFLGMDYKMQQAQILTPKEAYDCLRKELATMQKDGRIKYNEKIVINPIQNLGSHDAIPTYYIFSTIIYSNSGIKKYKSLVYAKGETMGFVMMIEIPVKERGDGAEHTKMILPNIVKQAEKYPALKSFFGMGNK